MDCNRILTTSGYPDHTAVDSYEYAISLSPDETSNVDAPFWVGVAPASTGTEALPYLRRAVVQGARWADLIRWLSASEPLPDDVDLIDRLVSAMQQ